MRVSIWMLSLLLGGGLLSGCTLWQPDWQIPEPTEPSAQLTRLLDRAEQLDAEASDRASLQRAMAAWRAVLAADPGHFRALTQLGNRQILFGAAYAEDLAERKRAYRDALQLNARAMADNAAFRARIERGEPLWEAVQALSEKELDAMGFWTTALFYYYKDCQGPIGQALNFRWMLRARQVLTRMSDLDPDWGEGSLHFLWGIYYLAIPEALGGDRDRSADYFARAIATGPGWLQHRWGRGRYFHVKLGNREASRADLEWVAAQDLAQMNGPYAWRVYIQRDARQILAELDRHF